jgi:hypothetical protein
MVYGMRRKKRINRKRYLEQIAEECVSSGKLLHQEFDHSSGLIVLDVTSCADLKVL